MPVLAASLATDGGGRPGGLRTTTLLAELGGWGGDVALLGSSSRSFLAGMGSFAAGHAAYVTGFARARATSPLTDAAGPRAVLAAGALLAPYLSLSARRHEPGLGVPVLGYAATLTAMAATAGHLRLASEPRRLTAAGAVLFLVSDTLLAVRMFVRPDLPLTSERAVMATYTGAQLLLAEGARRG